MAERVATSSAVIYNYDPPSDREQKVILLTAGKVAMIGRWGSGLGVIGWAPLPKRDKQEEDRRGL